MTTEERMRNILRALAFGLASTATISTIALAQQPPAPAASPAMTKAEAAVNAAFAQFTAALKAYEDEHRAELVGAERDRLAAEKALADERGAAGHAHTFTAGQKR